MPRKTKIGIKVAHVTRDSDTTFKVKRSKVKVTRPLYSPPCWRIRQLQQWAWERVGHEKLQFCCCLLGRANTSAPTGEERGGAYRGGRPPAYSLLLLLLLLKCTDKGDGVALAAIALAEQMSIQPPYRNSTQNLSDSTTNLLSLLCMASATV